MVNKDYPKFQISFFADNPMNYQIVVRAETAEELAKSFNDVVNKLSKNEKESEEK